MTTILVVDDDNAILELIEHNLNKENYHTEVATTGQEAIEKAKSIVPDLIVLDWMLPEVDGLEVCRQLRLEESTKNIPIILLTARNSEVDTVLGLEIGANDFIKKPFSPRELVARIRVQLRDKSIALEKTQVDEKKVIIQGPFYLDSEKYLAKVGERNLELSAKEFELLYLLVSNPGRVIRREEILRKVWGYSIADDTRTVNVHMRYLRRKVESDPDNPAYLVTVRGVGYKYQEPIS